MSVPALDAATVLVSLSLTSKAQKPGDEQFFDM